MESYASSSSSDSTLTGEMEMEEAVTSAIVFAASFSQHVVNPPRPIYQRVSVERDEAVANESDAQIRRSGCNRNGSVRKTEEAVETVIVVVQIDDMR
ncbi:hypothetical protein QVD17_30398 [Tagetes erecta]|uniref:Uncharacterized protein n=1 Tax=Tagetes erecta TaxID=13708 RepID=A0AAD8NM73_TARER|nr:hypothetical protein QVD17_30398 [Tagetes erecta]